VVVTECLAVNPVQFWLDCSTMHPVINVVQKLGKKSFASVIQIDQELLP
jgi:hypothetical protein